MCLHAFVCVCKHPLLLHLLFRHFVHWDVLCWCWNDFLWLLTALELRGPAAILEVQPKELRTTNTPVRLGFSGGNSGKTPETISEIFWNSTRKYGWEPPNPLIQGIETSRDPQHGWGCFFFRKCFRRGPLRAGPGLPSSTECTP